MGIRQISVILFSVAVVALLGNQAVWDRTAGESGFEAALFSKKSDSSKSVKSLERELKVLRKDGRVVGQDHISRLWNGLLSLWQKGAVSRSKAEELYNLLLEIYRMSNPEPAQKSGNAEQGTGATKNLNTLAKETKEEIERIAESNAGAQSAYLSEAHYDNLKKKLDYLTSQGITGLERYYQIIEERSPYAVKSDDEKRAAELAERKARQDDPYYDCPADRPAPVLASDITDFKNIQKITAPGTLTGDRDVAKGHSFIWTGGKRVTIYAPVDAILDSGSYYSEGGIEQYTLTFRIPNHCAYVFRFDHIHEVTQAIRGALNQKPNPSTQSAPAATEARIKAGEVIGWTTGNPKSSNWDFGLYDLKNKGPLSKINAFGMHSHAVCWVDYFTPEKQILYRGLMEGPTSVCKY